MLMVQVFEICPNCEGEGEVLIVPEKDQGLRIWAGRVLSSTSPSSVECLTCHGTGKRYTKNITLTELKRYMGIPEPPLGAQI